MVFYSNTEQQRTLRRLQLEGANSSDNTDVSRLQEQINILADQVSAVTPPAPTGNQGILNMIRNGDHNHSVNTWWETAPSASDKDLEAANVYAYPAFNPITITDANINALLSPGTLTSASAPFTAAMTGRYAIIEGAGVAGADLVALITYVSSTSVTISPAASTTVHNVNARINLLKLTHTNKKNASGTNPSDALKDSTHSAIGSNISDPDWHKENGTVRIGKATAVVGYPFGKFDNTGLIYVPLHQLFPGRVPIVRFNIARANQYVKIPGRIYCGIYNNNEAVLDWVKGSGFTLDSNIDGNPTTTVSTQYMVTVETDQGFTLVSNVITLASAPDDASMSAGARVSLFWTYFAGSTNTTIYRKRTGGNVYKMEALQSGANSWTDVNLSSRTDTGSTSFPNPADGTSHVASYWATSDGELDDITYDGQEGRFWQPIVTRLPFPPTVNLGSLFDPHLIIGLTEPLATELTDVVTNSTTTVTSAAAQFTAAMTGKTFTLTKSDGSASVTGTFTYVSATNGTLSTAATWTGTGATLVINDSQPNGLFWDLAGVSLNDGEWDYHIEDNSELRGQQVAANPNGSHQGGTGGGDPEDEGGDGGVTGGHCVLSDVVIRVRGERRRGFFQFIYRMIRLMLDLPDLGKYHIDHVYADQVTISDLLWNGLDYADEDFNEIERITAKTVNQIAYLETETASLPATPTHLVINEPNTYRNGRPISSLNQGKNVLISDGNSPRLEQVLRVTYTTGLFRVINFELKAVDKRGSRLYVANDVVSHNKTIGNNG